MQYVYMILVTYWFVKGLLAQDLIRRGIDVSS